MGNIEIVLGGGAGFSAPAWFVLTIIIHIVAAIRRFSVKRAKN